MRRFRTAVFPCSASSPVPTEMSRISIPLSIVSVQGTLGPSPEAASRLANRVLRRTRRSAYPFVLLTRSSARQPEHTYSPEKEVCSICREGRHLDSTCCVPGHKLRLKDALHRRWQTATGAIRNSGFFPHEPESYN